MKKPLFYIRYFLIKMRKIHRAQYKRKAFNERQKKNLVWFIILLMTISQLTITLYLPSMPNMAKAFHTDHTGIQLSLTLYLIAYGLSQFFYGPLSDIYGRRLIILSGLSTFFIASVAAVTASNIHVFWTARILQGIGIGCGDTMGRAILCDCFKEQQFVKAACHIGLAATITPLVGPIIGGYIETYLNWRANFLFILLYGTLSFLLVFRHLPETKPRELFGATNVRAILNAYTFILRNRIFLGFFIPGVVCFVGETVYSMVSPFLIQQQLGWGPIGFGWLSLFIILGLLMGTLIANVLTHYISHYFMVLGGLCALSIGGISMLMPSLFNYLDIISLIAPMMIFMMGIGITYPNTNMGALTPFTTMAGTAGALQGGFQMIIGGVLASLIGEIPNDTQFPLAMTLTSLSIGGLIAFYFLLKERRPRFWLERTEER